MRTRLVLTAAAVASLVGSASGTTVYTDSASFLAQLTSSYFNNFSSVPGGQVPSLNFSGNGFAYTISAQNDTLYNDPGIISTNQASDLIVVTFTGAPVYGIGGNMWSTDINVLPIPSTVTINLSNGFSHSFSSSSASDYRGFVSPVPITSFTIDAADTPANAWPTLDNLTVGTTTGGPPPPPPPPPSEPPGIKTTFSSNGPWNIPASGTGTSSGAPTNPYPLTINVSGITDPVVDVNVRLRGLNHTWPDDIDIVLVGPQGQTVMLMSDVGGSADLINVTLDFSMEVNSGPLPDNAQIVSGTYLPTNIGSPDSFPAPAPAGPYGSNLAAFYGLNPNGTWSLYVVDDVGGDTGSLAGWDLEIVVVPEPASLSLLAGLALLARRRRG
jgi:hypothetical protein